MNTNAILGAHPIDLLKALDRLFEGEDWYLWEPEVVLHELRDEVSEQAQDKVLAVQAVACNGSQACTKASAFENVVHAFNNNMLVVDTLQPPLIEEVMYAVEQLEKIIKYVHGDSTAFGFGSEIPGYIAAVAKYRDWVVLPARLEFAQDALDALTGLREGSKKYSEFKDTLTLIRGLVRAVGATHVVANEEIFRLIEEDTPKSMVIRLILGAYLYDPTLPFKQA